MTAVKPDLDAATVGAFLREHLGTPVEEVQGLRGGEICRAFAFSVAGERYVIRFGADDGGFHHDRYAFEHFAQAGIPIPRIHEIGRLGDIAFAVSTHATGSAVCHLPAAQQEAIAPAMVEMLDRIHQITVASTEGCGSLDNAGAGRFTYWPAYLRSVADEDPDDFFGRWRHLFDDSFLERPVYERLFEQMTALLPYCPEERFLVHGDFGFDNVIVHDGRITAVLDWANLKYGDFLFDVAWLSFWPSPTRYDDLFRRYYAEQGRVVPQYEERLRCYTCYIGLEALRFYAHTGQHDPYTWARNRALDLAGSDALT